MSVLSQCFSIIIDQCISAPGNVKEVVDVTNAIKMRYIYQLMSNVQLPGSKTFYSHIIMHSCTQKMMSVWINNSKNIFLRSMVNMESLIKENTGKQPVK